MTNTKGYKNGGWTREGKERFILFLKRVKRDRKSAEGMMVERKMLEQYKNVRTKLNHEIEQKRLSMKKKLDVHIDYDEDVNDDDDLASIDGDDVAAKNIDDSNECNEDCNSIQSLSTQENSQNLLSETSMFTGNAVPV